MGHLRLPEPPHTRHWHQVVAFLEGGAAAPQLAHATLLAVEQGLQHAARDKGLVESLRLLMRLPLAARSADFVTGLRDCGLQISDQPGLFEIVGALHAAVDRRLANNHGRTDLGEMAQMALIETVNTAVGQSSRTLFGTTTDEVRRALAEHGTVAQFGKVSRDFFARLADRFLQYYLGRELPNHVGVGRRFGSLAQQSRFTDALTTHCHEASRIVESFSGEWLSKTHWERGTVERDDAARFTHVAVGKLLKEFKRGAAAHGN